MTRLNHRKQAKVLLKIAHEKVLYLIGGSSSKDEIDAVKATLSSIEEATARLEYLLNQFTFTRRENDG